MQIRTIRTYKYRCYPSKRQISRLENHFSMCRHLYNWSLKDRIESYKNAGKTLSYKTQAIGLPPLKSERPWFKSVYCQVLQNVLKRLDTAYNNFFRRVKEETEKPGFPRFKKRGQWDSITYPQYSKKPENSKLYVPSIGTINIVYHREIPDDASIKTMSVVKDGGRWFLCFLSQVTVELESKRKILAPIGLDMGLIDFYYSSTGDHVPAPKYMRKREKQLKRLQRRFFRTLKYSPKFYRWLKALEKCHYRIKCQRNDFLHKQANKLLAGADIIVHENLSIKNMIRRPKPETDENGKYVPNGAAVKSGFNKSISDIGWFRFFEILKYKAPVLGKTVLAVPSAYTSQKS